MSFRREREQMCDTLKGGITDFPGSEIMSVFYETNIRFINLDNIV